VCLFFILAGFPAVLDLFAGWTPKIVIEGIASFSFLTHFNSITRGVIDMRDLVFFATLIAACLFANAIILDLKKAD